MKDRIPIRAVGFDIDGTLYPNFLMYLLSLPSFFSAPRLTWAFAWARREMRRLGMTGDFRLNQAELTARRLGRDTGEIQTLIEERLYRSWERSFRFLFPLPYVEEVLRELRGRGLKLGALSDFPVQNKLAYLGLEGLWDAALSSEEIGCLKPRPEPFQELARRLQTPPEAILYVGNSYACDILGARQAGMRTAYLCRRRFVPRSLRVDPPETLPDLVFSDYRDLPRFLEEEERKGRVYYHGPA
ncbi:MAG: HAD family hydrolase [Spirochaetales bacterium]|jgi:putative hydrolase of the HAD superfamily|nr:HAD family hydrolase [Spirochaetales bacterium]